MWAAHGERDVPDAVPVGQMGGLGVCADSAAVCCTSAISPRRRHTSVLSWGLCELVLKVKHRTSW